MASLKQKLRNWLKTTTKESNNLENKNTETVSTNTSISSVKSDAQPQNNTQNEQEIDNENDLINQVSINLPLHFNERGEIKLFENNSLIVYVQKATHQRRTRFQLQDSLFKIKIRQKDSVKNHLLLKDLLEVFEVAFKFVLSNLRTYFDAQNHHVAYLTLYQNPMVNGINTG